MATNFTVYEDDNLIVESLPSGIMVGTPYGCWFLPSAGAIIQHGDGNWHRQLGVTFEQLKSAIPFKGEKPQ